MWPWANEFPSLNLSSLICVLQYCSECVLEPLQVLPNILTPGGSRGDKTHAWNLRSNLFIFWYCTSVLYLTWGVKKASRLLKMFVNCEWGLKPLPDLVSFRARAMAHPPCRQMLAVDHMVTAGLAALSLDSPVLPCLWAISSFSATFLNCALRSPTYQPIQSLGHFLWFPGSWKNPSPPPQNASGLLFIPLSYLLLESFIAIYPLLDHKCWKGRSSAQWTLVSINSGYSSNADRRDDWMGPSSRFWSFQANFYTFGQTQKKQFLKIYCNWSPPKWIG